MTSRLERALSNRLAFLFIILLMGIAVFVIASPVLVMMGVAGLIYETVSLGVSLGFGIPALLVGAFAFWWIIGDDLDNIKTGEKKGANKMFVFLIILGIIEIIFGILQQFDEITFFKFTFIGGGVLSILPLLIYVPIVKILQSKGEVKVVKIEDKGIEFTNPDMNRLVFQYQNNKSGLVNEFLNILKIGNRMSRIKVLGRLERQSGGEIIPAILETLENDEAAYVKTTAADILGRIGSKQIVDQMRNISMKEQDESVRKKILKNIKKLEKI
jgi:hypothetical protein